MASLPDQSNTRVVLDLPAGWVEHPAGILSPAPATPEQRIGELLAKLARAREALRWAHDAIPSHEQRARALAALAEQETAP
jgi:hypothetical protein